MISFFQISIYPRAKSKMGIIRGKKGIVQFFITIDRIDETRLVGEGVRGAKYAVLRGVPGRDPSAWRGWHNFRRHRRERY